MKKIQKSNDKRQNDYYCWHFLNFVMETDLQIKFQRSGLYFYVTANSFVGVDLTVGYWVV